MGFFDFLNRQGDRDAGFRPLDPGALTSTRIVHSLLEVPVADRNLAWSHQFMAHVADAAFFPRVPSIIRGAGTFPYFALHSTPGEQPFPSHVLHHLKDDVLLEHGLGAVINPRGEDADWAFSYGDILHFHLYGAFYPPQAGAAPDRDPGLPPEARLPREARAVLRGFLARLGVAASRFRFGARDHAGPGSLELVFAFTPQAFRSLEDFHFAMNNLSWFLPKNYSYTVAGNAARTEPGFEPL